MLKPTAVVALSLLFLSACAQHPSQITLDLPPQQSAPPAVPATTVRLESQDLRPANYVVVIRGEQEPAELLPATQNLRRLLAEQLSARWQQQGVRLDPASDTRLRVELQQLLAEVDQQTLTHSVTSTIRIKVDYQDPGGHFSKIFRSVATQEGALKVKVAAVQQQLSHQLASLIDDIITDEQLRQRLQLIP